MLGEAEDSDVEEPDAEAAAVGRRAAQDFLAEAVVTLLVQGDDLADEGQKSQKHPSLSLFPSPSLSSFAPSQGI